MFMLLLSGPNSWVCATQADRINHTSAKSDVCSNKKRSHIATVKTRTKIRSKGSQIKWYY